MTLMASEVVGKYRRVLQDIRASILSGKALGLSNEEIVEMLTEKNMKAPYMSAEKALRLLFLSIADDLEERT